MEVATMGFEEERKEQQRKAVAKWLDDNFHIRDMDNPRHDELLDGLIDAVENPHRILENE